MEHDNNKKCYDVCSLYAKYCDKGSCAGQKKSKQMLISVFRAMGDEYVAITEEPSEDIEAILRLLACASDKGLPEGDK